MLTNQAVQIFAINKESGEKEKITDLYWFEESGVHNFEGIGLSADYIFEIYIDGIMVYPKERINK